MIIDIKEAKIGQKVRTIVSGSSANANYANTIGIIVSKDNASIYVKWTSCPNETLLNPIPFTIDSSHWGYEIVIDDWDE